MSLWIDQKYIGIASVRLNKFKKKSDKLYNFRCPFCGDSQKDKNKARGYLFINKDHMVYKCHNCSIATSLTKLLDKLDPQLANSYKLEKFSCKTTNTVIFTSNKFKHIKPIEKEKNDLVDIGLVPLHQMDKNSMVMKYVISRKIPEARYSELYYAKDMRILEKLNDRYANTLLKEERLIIPFYDSFGKLSGVTGRSLYKSNKRYINLRITEYPFIYGLKYIDATKPIYVLEGAIDSMFIDNAIAVGGSDLMRACNIFSAESLVLVFDNEPRNKEIVKTMEKMIANNYKLVIWPLNWKYKDINDAIVDNINSSQIMEMLYKNTHKDLSLKLAIRDWKKC